MTIQKNIKIDYGAVGDGVTDDSQAFADFQTFSIAQGSTAVELTIPAGSYNNVNCVNWTNSIKNLTVLSAGATIQYYIIGGPQFQTATGQAKLSRANSGESYVLLEVPSEYTRASPGDQVVVDCRDTQGVSGYPSNWVWWENHQVVAVSSGRWDLDAPLTRTYILTFPDSHNADYFPGGPAYAHLLASRWDQTITIVGGTWDAIGGSNQVQITAKEFYITGATFLGAHGCAPTFANIARFDTCTFSNGVEADKEIKLLQLINCTQTAPNSLIFQSASITEVHITGGAYNRIIGTTPQLFYASGATIGTMTIGSDGYGGNVNAVFDSCVISNIDVLTNGCYIDLTNPNCEYIGNGIFRYPVGSDISQIRAFAVPGMRGFFNGTGGGGPTNWGNPFTILDYYDDVSYTYMRISYSGSSLPSYSGTSGLSLTKLILHPAQSVTFRNCTGCADVVDLSQAPSQLPLFSYSRRTYTGDIGTQPLVQVWGKITSIRVEVVTPFTGIGALPFSVMAQFGAQMFDGSNVWSQYAPTVDLKTSGVRSWTAAGGWVGSVGADNLPPIPSGAWMAKGMTPYCGTTTAAGTVTVEISTDQGPDIIVGPTKRHKHIATHI